ncbi:hypothetical protein [Acidovorax soli]|uniref:Uncharacterized protein n=1 Tax=Acidovorax soli TaxID=592050 RepID=A0A1H4EI46_9BURK|nr:hypothetical protein [Acidovorax soli]SEA84754.1 hypothetical protein SAMN05421875_1363 [Acidovorax soli]
MSLPDLSFLHQARAPYDQGQAAPLPSLPPTQPQRHSPLRPKRPLAELITELRSHQAEREALQQGNAQLHASEKRRVAGHDAT